MFDEDWFLADVVSLNSSKAIVAMFNFKLNRSTSEYSMLSAWMASGVFVG